MKNYSIIYLIGGALMVWLSAGLWAQNSESDPPLSSPRQTWEHLALENLGAGVTGSSDLAKKINNLGDKGWQLVDVESITKEGTTQKTVYFFKRLK